MEQDPSLGATVSADPGAPAGSAITLPRGASIGRYLIVGELGAGGMGVVYAAYDPDLDRKVAVKLLRPRNGTGAAPLDRERLLREAQAMAQLSHPNVISVFDVGTHEGQVFVAMEFVDGGTLGQWLAERPRPFEEVVALFLQAGRGLAAAHEAGLVHRDFKPDNVLLGKDGRVRVMDFGLARSLNAMPDPEPAALPPPPGITPGSSLRRSLTRTGDLMGTPQYMAPEQYLCAEIGPRTDQFSFCVALYEALYGHPPFQGKSLAVLAHQVTQGLMHPIPRESRVPAWLARLVLRGLRTDPNERFPSMAALLAELDHDPGRARRRALLAAGAVLVLLLSGLALRGLRPAAQPCRGAERQLASIWDDGRRQAVRAAFLATSRPYAADTWRSVSRALDAYAAAWVAMHTEACLATHERGKQSPALLDLRMQCLDQRLEEVASLTALFSRADEAILQKANDAAHGLPPLATCADAAALTAKVPPPEDAATRTQVQRTYRQLSEAEALGRVGRYAEGLKGAQAVAQAAQRIGYAPLLSEALALRGDLEERTGDLSAAAQTVHQAGLAGIAGRHHKAAAQAFTLQAFLAGYLQDHPEEGRRWAELAQATLDGAGGDEALQAGLLNVKGMLAHRRGQEEEAARHLQQALTIRKRLLGPEHPEVAAVINNIALVKQRQERHDEAQALYLEALRITEQALGPEHPALAGCHYNLGLTMATAGKLTEALASFQRALSISERALGADHATSAAIHKELGDVLEDLDRAEEAEAHFLAALSIRQRRLGPESPQVAVVHSNLGHLLREKGRHAEALVHDRQALALREKHLGAADPEISAELLDVGSDLLGLGQRAEAAALFRRALQLQAARETSPLVEAEARFALARALWPSRRDRAEAARLCDEARAGYERAGRAAREDLARLEAWQAEVAGPRRQARRTP